MLGGRKEFEVVKSLAIAQCTLFTVGLTMKSITEYEQLYYAIQNAHACILFAKSPANCIV